MTYRTDRDQDQRLEQDECIEEIYLSGIGDAAAGLFPQQAKVLYLQGFAQGMRDYPRREVKLPVINADAKEFPLLCQQCKYLVNGFCAIKGTARNSSNYACGRIKIDCPF